MAMDNRAQSWRTAELTTVRRSFSRRLANLPLRPAGRFIHRSARRANFRAATVLPSTSGHHSSAHCSAWDYRHNIKPSLIFGATGVYLGINHFASRTWRHVPLKEAAIGFLFTLGTVAVINQKSTNLVLVLMLFGLLCSLNCLSISVWKRDLDIAQGGESFATAHPKRKSLPAMSCWILSVIGMTLLTDSKLRLFAFCLASSALLLALLHRVGRIDRDERVALADLVLLTPAVVFLFYCSHIR
jgi:hypothetical protein